MARFFRKRDESVGLPPGSLVFIGDKKTEEMTIRLIDYHAERVTDEDLQDIGTRADVLKANSVSWINVNGLHDTDRMRDLGAVFGLHALLLEDVMNTGQRPKLDEFEDILFVVVNMLRLDGEIVVAEQLSLVLGPTFLITFQERPGDVFEPVRNRIRKSLGRIRVSKADYLAYALLDTVVDNYIQIVERLGNQVEDLEVEVLSDANPSVLGKIHDLKRELSFLRKAVRPARDAILQLSKLDSALVHSDTVPFLKDLHDIAIQAADAIDTYREILSDELSMYNSTVSNKMNDIMKVLTIFAAIFIPLTFIAGIYGTNFEYVPELHYKYSYFVFWGVLFAVAVGMLIFFRLRRWF